MLPKTLNWFRLCHTINAADREQQLGIAKEMRYFVRTLITDVLRDAFANGWCFTTLTIWAFRFNHDNGNTIDKTNNIRAALIDTITAQHVKFFGEVEAVVMDMLPINQGNSCRCFFAINKFSDGDAIQQKAILAFITAE